MPVSHERVLRRIIRRIGSFPTRTYSNRISNDANVRMIHEERSGRVLNLNKTFGSLIRRVPIRRRTLANIRSCDRVINKHNKYSTWKQFMQNIYSFSNVRVNAKYKTSNTGKTFGVIYYAIYFEKN